MVTQLFSFIPTGTPTKHTFDSQQSVEPLFWKTLLLSLLSLRREFPMGCVLHRLITWVADLDYPVVRAIRAGTRSEVDEWKWTELNTLWTQAVEGNAAHLLLLFINFIHIVLIPYPKWGEKLVVLCFLKKWWSLFSPILFVWLFFVSFEEGVAMDTGKEEMTSFQYVICFVSANTA